jgi:hypothetical protein
MPALKLNTTAPHLKDTAHLHRPMAPFTLPTTIPKQAKAPPTKSVRSGFPCVLFCLRALFERGITSSRQIGLEIGLVFARFSPLSLG